MFSWKVGASKETQKSREEIWKLWSSTATWPDWDKEVEWARLDGPFVDGTRGELKARGFPKQRFELTGVVPLTSFTVVGSMPLTKMHFVHRIEEQVVTHEVRVKGLLAPLLWIAMRSKFKKALEGAVEEITGARL